MTSRYGFALLAAVTLLLGCTKVTTARDEFVAATEKKLAQLDARMDELGRESKGYGKEALAEADSAMASMREQRKALGERYESLKVSSSESWQDMKEGFANAMDEMEKAVEDAKARFKR